MLSTVVLGIIQWPFIVLALAQFPIYDAVIGLAVGRQGFARTTAAVVVIHVVAAGACFVALKGGSFDP